ncbi:MAG: flagellar cap protein FliD N-terminal domain-containing protein, partial [Gemmatimonadota bacterium]|nr:flagellar cap protein FliD N-terminal domain-containing protein [Gemmatimonadota bacterium]
MSAPISFTGLATGIDSDSIITQLLDIQRRPIERLENESETLALESEAMRAVNNQLLNLQNETLNLRLESTFSSRTVSSSDDTRVKATADFSAAKTNHRVKVTQLAQAATVSSSRYLSRARLLGSNTVGINLVGGENYINSPGAGRIKGGVALNKTDTLGSLGLGGDFYLSIDPDSGGSYRAVEITGLEASTTVGELIDKIREQVDSVKVQLSYDEALGVDTMLLSSDFTGVDIGLSGAVAEAVFGIESSAAVTSDGTSGLGSARATASLAPDEIFTGTATVVSSNGRAGSITGTVDLAAAAAGEGVDVQELTLAGLGVTGFDGFEIDPDASGATGNVAVLLSDGSKLTGESTVAEMIEAVNNSVPDVTAQLAESPGGAVYLRITANEGGRDVTVSQTGVSDGITQRLFGFSDTATSTDATSDSSDFTMVCTSYRRGGFSPVERRVVTGTEENYRAGGVTGLIHGVTLVGSSTGEVFTPGAARMQICSSREMAIWDNARTQYYGVTGVTDSSYATGLGLDAQSGGLTGINMSVKDLNDQGAFA